MRLLVKVKNVERDSKEIAWEVTNTIRTHGYQRGSVALDTISDYSRILIQGIVESNENVTSYIALDDISFTRGCQLEIGAHSPNFRQK